MQITLDEERWEVADELSVQEMLAQVSDRAHAKRRLVTSLEAGGRRLTDRDLQPAFLARPGREVGEIHATSQSLEEILNSASEHLRQFGVLVKEKGLSLIGPLRTGAGSVASLDAWFGLLADYVEASEAAGLHKCSGLSDETLASWIAPLLAARAAEDPVRLADLMEYELLPRLPGSS
ncbi:MAG: hypothetical protein C4293_18220 [Nitrospiraceae bacterium]